MKITWPNRRNGVLTLDPGTDVAKVREIPGVVVSGSGIEGGIDGIAAACRALGHPLPVQPPSTSSNLDGLRTYQQEGVGYLLDRLRAYGGALLADDMGLGKTLQSIKAAKELLGPHGRALIVAPAFLRASWRDELEKWGETSVAALVPKNTPGYTENWLAAPKAKWVVCSYDLAERALPHAFNGATPRVLIMDEAHYLSGRRTKRSKVLENVAALSTYKLAITGTPMWSRPRDLYQILKLLFGNRFGNRFTFDERYADAFENPHGGIDNRGASNEEELKLRVSYYMLRRLKEDVAKDLPALTRQVIWLDAEAQATAAFHDALGSKTAGATTRALEATLRSKMEPAMNAAQQARKFLLFTYRKDHAGEIWQRLNEEMDTPCELVTGDLGSDKRVEAVKRAAKAGHGLVATIDSMGAGINAQSVASLGIFHAIDYTPAKMLQAEARLHRIGQTENVQWMYFAMRESMDELVVKTVIDKLDAMRAVMGDGKEVRDAFDDSHAGGETEEEAMRRLYDSL